MLSEIIHENTYCMTPFVEKLQKLQTTVTEKEIIGGIEM